jgi:hypothetical protein
MYKLPAESEASQFDQNHQEHEGGISSFLLAYLVTSFISSPCRKRRKFGDP